MAQYARRVIEGNYGNGQTREVREQRRGQGPPVITRWHESLSALELSKWMTRWAIQSAGVRHGR
jgi:hypothetical protein